MIAMNVEGVSEACEDFVTELVQEALIFAEDNPDGFAPFGVVLLMDGAQWDVPDPILDDPDAALEAILVELSQSTESSSNASRRYGTVLRRTVMKEAWRSVRRSPRTGAPGQPDGRDELSAKLAWRLGDRPTERQCCDRADGAAHRGPGTPPSRRMGRGRLRELRQLAWELHADTYGYAGSMKPCAPSTTIRVPPGRCWIGCCPVTDWGELDRDDAIALLQPVAQWIAEILIRTHGARWDVVADGDRFAYVVVLDGGTRQLDPYAFVAEYSQEPLPSVRRHRPPCRGADPGLRHRSPVDGERRPRRRAIRAPSAPARPPT